jgi:hypothetical protein
MYRKIEEKKKKGWNSCVNIKCYIISCMNYLIVEKTVTISKALIYFRNAEQDLC